MAKYTTFLALLLCLFLVAATEIQMAEGKYCCKKSDKWNGPCQYSYKCSYHCKHYYGAKYGICKKYKPWGHKYYWAKYACYCYSPCHY
ncbi:defensin D1-like [Solanum verrucosum]|uniref:defensin D1-like n=1 Tax=Solanum verrucosum TaxID=315347 RepID=UPI0020D19C93|nr:defensin D1-like [Solanum verrucosum]